MTRLLAAWYAAAVSLLALSSTTIDYLILAAHHATPQENTL